MRTARWKRNTKSKRLSGESSPSGSPATKMFKVGNRSSFRSSDHENEDNEDYIKHLDQLKKEWESRQSVQHIRTLLKETRKSRQRWQTTLQQGTFQPILHKFPCFEEGSFVSLP